jgi:hypothetical protein
MIILLLLYVLQNSTILYSMPILETISTLKRQQSGANNWRMGIRCLSGIVSSVSLAGVSTDLTEWNSAVVIGLVIGVVIRLVSVTGSGHLKVLKVVGGCGCIV